MENLRELIRDIDKHMRAEWYAGRLPAESWPKSLSDRLAAAVAEKPWPMYEGGAGAIRAVGPDDLKAVPAAVAVPDGWKLVPELPTQDMCESAKYGIDARLSVFKWADGYKAMLSSAPEFAALAATPAAAPWLTKPPLTADEARQAARTARLMNGPSDTTQPPEYAMAGALALAAKIAASPAAAPVVLPEPVGAIAWNRDGERPTFHAGCTNKALLRLKLNEGLTGGPYRTEFAFTEPQLRALLATGGQAQAVDIAELVIGTSVSVDVSTGDDDAGNRYFGTVTVAQEDPHDKHGLTLLVQDAKPNFTPQAQADARDADGMYYLQDARHSAMVGNCPSWWRPNGNGYTTNLDEAARFTLDEAMAQHRCRDTDLPWLCSEVDKLRRATVDCQYMPRSWDAQRESIAAIAATKGSA